MDPFGRGGGGVKSPMVAQTHTKEGWPARLESRMDRCLQCNHKLKATMDLYLDRYSGQIHLAEGLNVAGKWQEDLPMLPRFCYANSRPFLCWKSTLGQCMYHK